MWRSSLKKLDIHSRDEGILLRPRRPKLRRTAVRLEDGVQAGGSKGECFTHFAVKRTRPSRALALLPQMPRTAAVNLAALRGVVFHRLVSPVPWRVD